MEPQATQQADVRFFPLAYMEAEYLDRVLFNNRLPSKNFGL